MVIEKDIAMGLVLEVMETMLMYLEEQFNLMIVSKKFNQGGLRSYGKQR